MRVTVFRYAIYKDDEYYCGGSMPDPDEIEHHWGGLNDAVLFDTAEEAFYNNQNKPSCKIVVVRVTLKEKPDSRIA